MKAKELDYLVAVNVAMENYADVYEEEIPDEHPDPETTLLRKQAYYSLSDEARRVIRIIINSPIEVLETIAGSPKRKKLSASRIERHLAKKWKSPSRARRVVNEIKGFVRTCL